MEQSLWNELEHLKELLQTFKGFNYRSDFFVYQFLGCVINVDLRKHTVSRLEDLQGKDEGV